MLIGTIQNAKGYSQFFIDLLGNQELQLLKAKRGGEENQIARNNKKYLIITQVQSDKQTKVHYPLPLSPVETGAFMMDKETMKRMVKRMSQTLSEFKGMNITNNTNNFNTTNSNFGRQTAKEFFSKENLIHPVVEENIQLKQKLKSLEEAKSKSGAVSLNNLQTETNKIEQDFQFYQNMTEKEMKKLKLIKQQLQQQINEVKTEINSERPQSAYSQLSYNQTPLQNQTMTSNFNGSNMNEVEELRKQLADASVELEEMKENYKKRVALQQKEMEEYYEEIGSFKNEERAMRVKVNQLENELELNLKRLDIICKSKGLPRPQLRSSSAKKGSNYVSPYRQTSGTRNASNSAKRPSPYRNYNYTPPNKRNYSPASNQSNGSNNKFKSPSNLLKNRQQSPGAKSNQTNNSKNSNNSQNRLYSPSGRIRGTSNMYGSNKNGGAVNRVRREGAVSGSLAANSRSGSRGKDSPSSSLNGTNNSRLRNSSYSNNSGKYGQQRKPSNNTRANITTKGSVQNKQPAYQTNQERKISLIGGNKVLDEQKANIGQGSIDEKIEKLQSLLKIAKSNNN